MPLFYYYCNKCKTEIKRILPKEDLSLMCAICQQQLERTPKPPKPPVVTETLDNGTQARPVTQLKDIQEIIQERTDKDLEEHGKPIEIIK